MDGDLSRVYSISCLVATGYVLHPPCNPELDKRKLMDGYSALNIICYRIGKVNWKSLLAIIVTVLYKIIFSKISWAVLDACSNLEQNN